MTGFETDLKHCPNATQALDENGKWYAVCKLIEDTQSACPVMTLMLARGLTQSDQHVPIAESGCVRQDEFASQHAESIFISPVLRHKLNYPVLRFKIPKKPIPAFQF